MKIDWHLGETLYQQTLSLKKVAEEMSVNYATVRSYAMRHNWAVVAAKARLMTQQRSLKERGGDWQRRIADLIERHLAGLEKRNPANLGLRDLELLSAVIEKIDKVGRRTFELDSMPNGATIGLALSVEVLEESAQAKELAAANKPC